MSNATAPSTNLLTKSNGGNGERDYPFSERVFTIAARSAKGTTRERLNLNKQSLVDSLRNDYRSCYTEIYGKGERLPSDICDKIDKAVSEFISKQLARVNESNVIGFRRAFHWKEKDSSVTERLTSTGENSLSLEEQHFGIVQFIIAAEKRLAELEAKKTPDYDLEKDVKNRIIRLNNTKAFIEREIQHQQELAKQAK
jgi:hypothetical protein